MKSIGFKNFRKFEDFKQMALGPVTLLVGGNNAGKSTVGKAVRLLMANLSSMQEVPMETSDGNRSVFGTGKAMFRFDADPQIRIHSFHEALRHSASRKEMTFTTAIGQQEILLKVTNDNAKLPYGTVDYIELTDHEDNCRFEVSLNEHTMRLVRISDDRKKEELEKKLVDLKVQITHARSKSDSMAEQGKNMMIEQMRLKRTLSDLMIYFHSQETETIFPNMTPEEREKELAKISAQRHDIELKLADHSAAINQMMRERDLVESQLQKLQMALTSHAEALKRLTEESGEVIAEYPISLEYGNGSSNMLVCYAGGFVGQVYSATRQKSPEEIKEAFEQNFRQRNPSLRPGDEDYKKRLNEEWEAFEVEEPEDEEDRQDMPEVAKMVQRMVQRFTNTVGTHCIRYIEAHEAEQDTYYRKSDGRWMSSVLDAYVNKRLIRKEHLEHKLVKDWLAKLEIAKDFLINVENNEIFSVELQDYKSGEWVNLAELGKGAIQYFALLLNLAVIIREFRGRNQQPTVLIEEPEQNMHPNWQSHLADLFYELSQKNEKYGLDKAGLKFLIETHSEYLVRKTQVIVGDLSFSSPDELQELCPFATYYLPQDRDYYSMGYQLSGLFENKFEPGFLDEAGRSQMAVMKKAREMANV